MRALSAAARKGKRRPDRKLRVHLTLSREEWALVQAIGARAGLSQSAVVSKALAALVELTSGNPPAKREADLPPPSPLPARPHAK